VRTLCARNLGTPALAVIDGNPGLEAALRAQWPKLAMSRAQARNWCRVFSIDTRARHVYDAAIWIKWLSAFRIGTSKTGVGGSVH
jgi:hypothetical protein